MSQSGVPEPNQQSSSSKSVAETLLSPSILEAVPDAVTVVNRQGVIIQANSQTETLFACTRDELIGPRIEILVLERQRPEHDRQREQFHSKSKIRRMGSGLDLYGRRRDGSEFPVEISLSPVSTPDGTMVLSVIRDISDCKHIEEELRRVNELRDSQNRLALIVDSWHDAIIGKNLDGIVTHWNKGAEQIYGYTAQAMLGRSISMLAPREREDEIPTILEKIRKGQRVEYFESVRITKDKRTLNVSISVSPIYDAEGKVVGASTIARDISAQKKTEEQLRQSQKMEVWDGWPAGSLTTSIICWELSPPVLNSCGATVTRRAWNTSTTFAKHRNAARP
jgi:PAS domain S-box-containing protein